MEELFSAVAARRRSMSDSALKKKSLTTSERAMGMAIGLKCFKLTAEELRAAVLCLDEDVMNLEGTERLLACESKSKVPTCLPTSEEIEAAKAYVQSGEPLDALDDASKYIIQLH